jgi:hypothetical protein
MLIIGIDPGNVTGVAAFTRDGGLQLKSFRHTNMLLWLDMISTEQQPQNIRVYFEDSRLQKSNWSAYGQSPRAAAKIGRNIGSVDAKCTDIERLCRSLEIPATPIAPLKKGRNGKKVGPEDFARITGFAARTNQHCRDACMVMWPQRMEAYK